MAHDLGVFPYFWKHPYRDSILIYFEFVSAATFFGLKLNLDALKGEDACCLSLGWSELSNFKKCLPATLGLKKTLESYNEMWRAF